MKNLERYIALYMAMDDRRRAEALKFAELQVSTFTRKAPPLLRLVAATKGK